MLRVGIEALNVFGGTASLDVAALASHRGLDMSRFENLLMDEKAVALPFEDPVTYAVNAAYPVVKRLSEEERNSIELLITCTETGIDFSKSLSTYVHDLLGLSRNCRMFEIKQACFSGTAGLQMAVNFVLAQVSPGARALVVTTDLARYAVAEGGDALTMEWSYAEPSAGAGAVAMLVSASPKIFTVDVGANGNYGYEVMDTCRPVPDSEAGDSDLSLMSYMDCAENAYAAYAKKVPESDYRTTFDYLAFHTPFGGMVKGTHRAMMRKIAKAPPGDIELDFKKRVLPGLTHCRRVGNIMGGTVYMALAGLIESADFDAPRRIGVFSYGSGCCSEFFSGVAGPASQQALWEIGVTEALDRRYRLSLDEYEGILRTNDELKFGVRNTVCKRDAFSGALDALAGRRHVVLKAVNEYHREYEWVG